MATSSLEIKLWGVRGSLPSPVSPDLLRARAHELCESFLATGVRDSAAIPAFLNALPAYRLGGYGGNTPCIEVTSGDTRLIVDAGSGLRALGQELMTGDCGSGKGEVHILFTHFHWDHLIGLPFFIPIFVPGNIVHVYAVQPNLIDIFKTVFQKPYFPVPLQALGAKIVYHQLKPRVSVPFGDIQVTPYQLDHPDPCWGYRFEAGGKVYSHCVDTECKRVSRTDLGPDLPLYQGVDLMVFDAQYTLLEQIEKVDWGHAAASLGLDIAMREGIKKMIFMHHDPASLDERIASVEAQTRRYYEAQLRQAKHAEVPVHEVDWEFAREGTVIRLVQP